MSESRRTGKHKPSLPNVYRVARRVLAAVLVSGLVAAVPASKPLPLPALARLPDDGLARTPPMGWNSWNHFAGRITAADVRAMADAMVANGMRDAGYTYVNIDDTWEGERDAAGHLQTNAKFGDMKALADYIHARGLKLASIPHPAPKPVPDSSAATVMKTTMRTALPPGAWTISSTTTAVPATSIR